MGQPDANQIRDIDTQSGMFDAPPDSVARRPDTILCVDDNETNRYTRGRTLRSAGFEVIEAANGADALRLAAGKQPSLVLLDVQLPGINGFAVCRRLKSDPKTALIPVLHISSLGKVDHEYPEALESGAEAYLQEPVEPPVLIAVIKALIRAASAEARARKTERDAVDILESIGEAMYLFDQDYRFSYVNAEAERLLGIERAAMIGKTHSEVFPESAGTTVDREYRRVMTERTPSSFENFYEPWQRWYEIKANPVSGGGIAVHFRDITDRKRAEDERQRLVRDVTGRTAAIDAAALFPEQNPDPVLRVREDGALLYANSSSNALLSEWNCGAGQTVPTFLREPVEVALAEGSTRELELAAGGRDYSFLIAPIKDAGCANLYGRDITGHKRAGQALRESEERFRMLVSASSDVLYRMSPDWTEMRQLGGGRFIPDQERPSKDWLQEYIHPDDQPEVLKAIQKAIRTRSVFELEHRVRRVDGSLGWTLSRAVPLLDAQGEIIEWFGAANDVTARKLAEQALRESEERYRTLFTSMNEGFAVGEAICDENGTAIDFRFIEINDGFERQSGLGREILGKPARDVFPNLEQVWIDSYCRVALTGESIKLDRYNRDTRRHYSVFCYSPSRGRFAILFSDITDLKRADQALRESEERFRTMADGCPTIIWVTDAEGENRFVNRAYREFFGATYDQVEGRKWQPLVHPDDSPAYMAALFRAVRERTPFMAEARLRRADGEWRWVASYGEPRFSPNGEFLGHAGISPDITERKRAEEALADAMQRLDAHMDNSPLAVIEFDRQLLVTRWSKEAEKVFGWTAAEILGRPMFEIPWIHNEDSEAVGRVAQGMLDGTHPRNLSVNRNHRRDGSVIECEWYNSAIYDAQGNLSSILSQVLDVTGRKRTEERLRQAQKMESVALLAGGVAHDFNNLLVGVIGNASLAMEMLPPESPAEELLERIIKSGEQAAHLTRQMLAYSGKGRFVMEPVDLSDVVREVTDLVRSTAPRKIAMQLDLEPGLPPIEADRGQIHQVLMNLVINATEAIGNETGLIAVQTGAQSIDDQFIREMEGWDITPGGYVFLEVRDTGCGMDEATKARIFDPFFTTKFHGRGLGLAAVAGIVRGHKGAIRVRTAPGRGASFLLLLPAMESHPAVRVVTRRRAPEQDLHIRGAILVVDDEETIRDMAKVSLERRNCNVLVASSGSEALTVLTRNADAISLVILDLGMPGLSGQEVLPKLLAINPRLDVVVSSGYAEADALRLFEGMPVADFIQKPYTVQQLVETVKRVLDRKNN